MMIYDFDMARFVLAEEPVAVSALANVSESGCPLWVSKSRWADHSGRLLTLIPEESRTVS